MYKTRQTFYGLLFTSHMSTNPKSFVRIYQRVFAVESPKVAEISKNAVFGIFDHKLHKAMYRERQTF